MQITRDEDSHIRRRASRQNRQTIVVTTTVAAIKEAGIVAGHLTGFGLAMPLNSVHGLFACRGLLVHPADNWQTDSASVAAIARPTRRASGHARLRHVHGQTIERIGVVGARVRRG